MKKIHYFLSVILTSLVLFSGCKYDDKDLWKELDKQAERIAALEAWSKTVNTNITALQGLVSALENNDFLTGVTPIVEGGVEIGYTITFTKSPPITIFHGEKGGQGDKGEDGLTPTIGVRRDTDGKYYWTLDGEWLMEDGNKIPTTGENGKDGEKAIAPQVKIDTNTASPTYGMWLISMDGGTTWTSTGVNATGDKGDTGSTGATGPAGSTGPKGDQGDAIFAKDGIDLSDPLNVTFTLAGTPVVTITLPRSNAVTVSFKSTSPVIEAAESGTDVVLVLPATLKAENYTALYATVQNADGTGMDVQVSTRGAATDNVWGVTVTPPTFNGGAVDVESAKVRVTPPTDAWLSDQAILKVTIVNNSDMEYTISRPVKSNPTVVLAGRFGGKLVETGGVWQFEKDLYVAIKDASSSTIGWAVTGHTDATGVTNAWDGKSNTLALNYGNNFSSSEGFPAANLCFQKNPGWRSISGKEDAGYNWYLPAQNQLMALWGVNNGLGTAAFSASRYWSATEHNSGSAWYTHFNGSITNGDTKTKIMSVRCVREASPAGEGVKVYKDGSHRVLLEFAGLPADAVTDTKKYEIVTSAANNAFVGGNLAYSNTQNEKVYRKLEIAPFDMNDTGEITDNGTFKMNWAPAYNGCKGADGGGWRLPTQRELQFMWIFRDGLNSIFDGLGNDAAEFFTAGDYYWSATEQQTNFARFVRFSDGYTNGTNKTGSSRVRCVREISG